MSITWVLLGKFFLKYRGNAADGGGLFRFLRAEDVPPEQFAPLAVRQAQSDTGCRVAMPLTGPRMVYTEKMEMAGRKPSSPHPK
jgi:hypothetical protein